MSVSRLARSISVIAVLLVLWGCGGVASFAPGGPAFTTPRKPETWRRTEESRCMALGLARASPFLTQRSSLGGPGQCGAPHAFEMSGALNGRVAMHPAATLRCEMIPAVEKWMADVVLPGARRQFGIPVVEIKVAASYSCRPRNNIWGAKLSEHGHANALDVSGFKLADGRWIMVKQGWSGDPEERAFLHRMHDGACKIFTTVLGPNADRYHHDHFHLDLAWHGKDGRMMICR
jgi:hypothetical protein